MHEREFTEGFSPCMTDEQRKINKIFIDQTRELRKVDIETNLRLLVVANNLESEEVFKHIWLTLLLNTQLTVDINDPRRLKNFSDLNYFMVDEKSTTTRAEARQN